MELFRVTFIDEKGGKHIVFTYGLGPDDAVERAVQETCSLPRLMYSEAEVVEIGSGNSTGQHPRDQEGR